MISKVFYVDIQLIKVLIKRTGVNMKKRERTRISFNFFVFPLCEKCKNTEFFLVRVFLYSD